MEETLQFPFVKVENKRYVMEVPGMDEAFAACPDEFKKNHHRNVWCEIVNQIFFGGISSEQGDMIEFKTEAPEIAQAQWAFFNACLGSFKMKHEHKTALCGWLLSLMLDHCPDQKAFRDARRKETE